MAVIGALGMALGSLNFGLFIRPMGDDLGIGRGAFGLAQSARQVTGAIAAPWVGSLIDRFGARILLAVAAVITGAALATLGFITSEWQLIALFGIVGVLGVSGPGALVVNVPVMKWFVRKRGRALAYMSLGAPVGGVLFVPATQLLIDGVGWRGAWIVLAAVGAGLIVPMALIFVRRQPEDYGLRPDGEPAPELSSPRPATELSWTRAEALRSGTFWRLVIAFSLFGFAVSAIALHRIAAFMDRGMDPTIISLATAVDAGASGVATFTMGMLIHRVPARFLGAIGFLILAVASVLTIVAHDHYVMFVSMSVFGLGIGTWILVEGYLWASYFGREHLGSIRGAVMPLTLIAGGAGAPIAGYIRDLTGAYEPFWYGAVAIMLVSIVILVFTPPPVRAAG